ncbi:MAG: ribosome biogenesis GTPase Der [Chloroflexota bacterium]
MTRKALVALVGRPNVGKSTLFNRIVGRRMAVVSETPGTTRDRLYSEAEWTGVAFTVVDTGGIELTTGWTTDPLSQDSHQFLESIVHQARVAIQDADVIVMVVDGQSGVTSADREVAEILRQSDKPTLVAANKLESTKMWDDAYEFYELGLGQVIPLSALHGTNVGDFLDELVAAIPPVTPEYEVEDTIRIALLGKPNVGKSTLLNRLLGQERAIVSPLAGTTRDAIDSQIRWHGQELTLIDTAGIRRRGKIEPGVEKYSVLRAIKALDRADVALLLLDATMGITAQDMHVGGMITEEEVGVVILVNKWDAVIKDAHSMPEYVAHVRQKMKFLPYAPLLFISAETGQRVSKILPLAIEVNEARQKRIPTSKLNKLVRDAVMKHPPPQKGGVRVKFYYATQAETVPPTFIFFVNKPDWVHFTYQRYLENQIREFEPFTGTPIRLRFRPRSDERYGR